MRSRLHSLPPWLGRHWRVLVVVVVALWVVGPHVGFDDEPETECNRPMFGGIGCESYVRTYGSVGVYTLHPSLRLIVWNPRIGVRGFGVCSIGDRGYYCN